MSTSKGVLAYRATTLLQPHRARDAIRDAHDGKKPPLYGFYCGLPCSPISKIAAQMDFDFTFIDWEHAAMNTETMNQMVHDIQFVSEGRQMAVVRIPDHSHASIAFAMDAGASIVCPQVDTVEQARHIIAGARLIRSEKGLRSAPPARWLPGVSANSIDTSISFHSNLNQIDAVWIGTFDARVSMGLTGLWGLEPEWLAAFQKYGKILKKFDMPSAGLALCPDDLKTMSGKNKCFIVVATDYFGIIGEMAALGNAR